jgi:hypothetical protein
MVELVVERNSFRKSLHPNSVPTSDTGHGTGRGLTVQVRQGDRDTRIDGELTCR